MTQEQKQTPMHPVLAALHPTHGSAVELSGYVGESSVGVFRLYLSATDASEYVELDRSDVIHIEPVASGTDVHRVTAFVFAAAALRLTRHSRVLAGDYTAHEDRPEPRAPFQGFERCSAHCEATFAAAATRYLVLTTRAAQESNPTRQTELYRQAYQLANDAKAALLVCLEQCLAHGPRPGPAFMYVHDPDAPGGRRRVRFTLAGYHAELIYKYLEPPE